MRLQVIALLFLGATGAVAQDRSSMSVFADAPPGELPPSASVTVTPNGPAPAPREPISSPFLQWSLQYSDGLQSGPGKPTSTYLRAYTAGFDFRRPHWTLNYAHAWTDYSNNAFVGSQSDALGIDGSLKGDRWRASGSQTYSSENQPNSETATQVRTTTIGTSLQAVRLFGSRLVATTSASQRLSLINGANGTKSWQLDSAFQYSLSQGTSIGIILGGTYTKIDHAPDTAAFRPGLSLDWAPTAKIAASVNVFAEQLHFSSGPQGTMRNLTYASSLTYHPFEATALMVQGTRQLTPSVFTNNYLTSEAWSIGLKQRFLGHLNFGATYSHSSLKYILTRLVVTPSIETEELLDNEGQVIGLRIRTLLETSAVFLDRNDIRSSIDLSLGVAWLKHGTASVIYRRSLNSTNAAGFGYASKLIGVEAGWHF